MARCVRRTSLGEPVVPPEYHEPPQWIIGFHNQIPTILSLLTPVYQQRLVQQFYHQAHDHADELCALACTEQANREQASQHDEAEAGRLSPYLSRRCRI